MLALFALIAVPAHAGTYDVLTCDAAPNGSAAAWTLSSTDGSIAAVANCPSGGSASGGISLYDHVGSGNSVNACYGCTGSTYDRRHLQLGAKFIF